jgi:hypothetical protein
MDNPHEIDTTGLTHENPNSYNMDNNTSQPQPPSMGSVMRAAPQPPPPFSHCPFSRICEDEPRNREVEAASKGYPQGTE